MSVFCFNMWYYPMWKTWFSALEMLCLHYILHALCPVLVFMNAIKKVNKKNHSKLFQQYCMVFYGFQNCALYNKDIERLYVTSRKAIWILCKLPYQTHSALLPYIIGIPPLDVGISKRFFKHVHTGFNHENSLVRFILWKIQCILIPE